MLLKEERIKEVISYRRKIHSYPELMFEEHQTSKMVCEHLNKLNFSYEYGIAKTGIACLIDSGKPGKTLLVRADMDALPIQEENKVEYASKRNGVMHACGHDGHTAVLMGLASEIWENRNSIIPKGRILLVFQPAEEGGGGADKMVEEGIIEKYSVDAAIAMHVWNHIDVGKVGVVDGAMMASVDEFEIIVQGKSGHGAMPQYAIDPIVVCAHIVTALQTIVSRNVDPLDACVLTVGSIHSGDAFNVIPETATMVGTVRTFSKKTYELVPKRMEEIVQNIAKAFGANTVLNYKRINKPTINDPKISDVVRRSVIHTYGSEALTEENVRSMGGEDFSAFLDKVPGSYFLVGSRNVQKGFVNAHHNSKFDFDEKALEIGLTVLKETIRLYLSE